MYKGVELRLRSSVCK